MQIQYIRKGNTYDALIIHTFTNTLCIKCGGWVVGHREGTEGMNLHCISYMMATYNCTFISWAMRKQQMNESTKLFNFISKIHWNIKWTSNIQNC